jgi:hypothetical protein
MLTQVAAAAKDVRRRIEGLAAAHERLLRADAEGANAVRTNIFLEVRHCSTPLTSHFHPYTPTPTPHSATPHALARRSTQLPFHPRAARLTHHHSPARTRIDRFLGVFEIKL